MQFELHPILSEMKAFYSKPISFNRIKEYRSKLQGNTKDDLVLPITGYNPMAKDHILEKIKALEDLKAEAIMIWVKLILPSLKISKNGNSIKKRRYHKI